MNAPRFVLVGLAGVAGSGKDVAGEHLQRYHGFTRYAFANPIRDMLHALMQHSGIDMRAWSEERSLKEQPIPGIEQSYRRLAQTLGTEWGRTLDATLWLRIAGLRLGLPHQPRSPRMVITDVRMPNEAAWIQAMGGQVWRIDRPTAAPVAKHSSEQLIGEIRADAAIDNSSSFRRLYEQLDWQVGTL